MSYAPTRPWATVTVGDAMTRGVISCAAATPLSSVAETMAERRIHCLIVSGIEQGGSLGWRVLADLDLVRSALAGDVDGPAATAAAGEALAIEPGAPLERAAQLMTEHETAHLVVVAPDSGLPVGVISSLDVACAIARER